MKIKVFAILAALVLTAASYAQSKEEKLIDKMCREACDEINKTEFKDNEERSETEMKLGLALLPSFSSNAKEIKKVWGLDVKNPDHARQLGEKIGGPLVYKCEKFKTIALNLAQKEIEASGKGSSNENSGSAGSVQGWISRLECNDVCIIYFTTTSDETVKLYWMEKFDGSDILEQFTDANKKNKFNIKFKEISIYQPKEKSYQTVKVITAIE